MAKDEVDAEIKLASEQQQIINGGGNGSNSRRAGSTEYAMSTKSRKINFIG
jgi:hypothetical protein